jgi:RNA polymerase sigma-70 factor, ECF subfamily
MVVGVNEGPPEPLRERVSDGRLAGSRRPHDDNHHFARSNHYNCHPAVTGERPFRPDADEQATIVYHELRRLAAAYMRRERQGFTLQATALVHEAYLRLAGSDLVFNDRNHFIGIAARSMRQILVDRARARGAQKRWAGLDRVSLTESLVRSTGEDAMLPALDEALTRLEQVDPEQARIIELRYFVGLSVEEAADVMKISPATLKRRFAMARAWLFRELEGRAA